MGGLNQSRRCNISANLQTLIDEARSSGTHSLEKVVAEINNRYSISPNHIRLTDDAKRANENELYGPQAGDIEFIGQPGTNNQDKPYDEDEGYAFIDRAAMMRVPNKIFGETGYSFRVPFAPQCIRNSQTGKYCGIAVMELNALDGFILRQDVGVYTDSSSPEGAVGGAVTKATRRLLETLGDAGGLMLADPRFDKELYGRQHLMFTQNKDPISFEVLEPVNRNAVSHMTDRYGIHPDHIDSEPAPWDNSKSMFFIKRPGVFRILNANVGFAGWKTRVAHAPQFRESGNGYYCHTVVALEVLGSVREEAGVSTNMNLSAALMGSYTKALKRAFSTLGNMGGLMLWNDNFDNSSYASYFERHGSERMPTIPGVNLPIAA